MRGFLSMQWLEPFIALILMAMTVILVGNICGRYFFSAGFSWTDEVVRFLFVWLTFLAATLGLVRGAHIGMDLISTMLPQSGRRLLALAATGLTLLFLVVFGWQAMQLVLRSMTFKTPALGLPKGAIYAIAPFCAVLMSLICLDRFWRLITGKEEV